MRRPSIILHAFILLYAAMLAACGGSASREQKTEEVSGALHIIHAGSLTLPVHEIGKAFNEVYPNVKILSEAWGSKAGARRITELQSPADVFISADYMVIENLMMPEFASWNIRFAGNEMAIVYGEKSRYRNSINAENWHEILLQNDVAFGRSDPDADPCGVRAVLSIKLAGLHYGIPDLPERFLNKDKKHIRPKETDLLALLHSGNIDYIFLYRSVAEQHHLDYLVLPDEINLGNPQLEDWYAQVQTETAGRTPKERIVETGQPMVYGITIPKTVKNHAAALAFVKFFLEKEQGQAILESLHQPSLVPSACKGFEDIPQELHKYVLPPEQVF